MENLLQLEKRVDTLLAWKKEKEVERLSYPLDIVSKRILQSRNTRVMVATGNTFSMNLTLLSDTVLFGMYVLINGQKRYIYTSLPYRIFTANAGTDTLTNSNGQHNLSNGDVVCFLTDGTLPTGLDGATFYYIVNRAGSTFQVSLTRGGGAVDLIDGGTGNNYYAFLSGSII